MSSPAPAGPPEAVSALRADLVAADYTVEHLADLLGPVASGALHREQPLPADLVTRERADDPTAVLVRAFVLGLPVPIARLAAALPRTGAEGLHRLGLVAPVGGPTSGQDGAGASWVVGSCDLRPYGDEQHTWWVVSDSSEPGGGEVLGTEHVLGVGGASTTLSSWTPRPSVGRALDLGTGCGVQALHLAGHAGQVLATDLSARALAYARLTADLNETSLELRHGSLLEPVAGERFDLVVSNPPFVITPRHWGLPRFDYRDGGEEGDAVVAGLVGRVADHLEPGGIAQLLGNWELGVGMDWAERVAGWLDGTGLDAWVVQREVADVAEYAETWARDGGHRPGTPAFTEMYAAWLADFAARGVERVGFGVLTLQQPVGDREPWRDLVEVRGPVASPMGPAVLAGLRARTWLAEHDDQAVLDTAWVVAPDVTEERHGRPGAPDPSVILLRQGGGLRRTVTLDTLGAAVVGVCDGELSAGQITHAVAALTDVQPAAALAAVVPVLRGLIADGFLTGEVR